MDWITVAIYVALVILGWFSIYAATYDFDNRSMMDLSGRAGMQMVWILTSLAIACALLLIDNNWYEVFSVWIYVAVILLLVLTVFVAPDIKGSRSWLVIIPGKFQIQPAEFAKFATALVVAKFTSSYKFEIMNMRNLAITLALIFLPMVLILLQQETGSALVFLAFFLVLYREGMPGAILFSGFSAIVYFVLDVRYANLQWGATSAGECMVLILIILFTFGFLYNYAKGRSYLKYAAIAFSAFLVLLGICHWILRNFGISFSWILPILGFIAAFCIYLFVLFVKDRALAYLWMMAFALCSVGFLYSVDYVFDNVLAPHQKIRIEVALGIVDDPSGVGYNVNQSKIAIGSGGFAGKGFLNGTQTKLKYVPEQDTDFIFCTIGEEKGFIGTAVVMLLFVILILRQIYLAERQRSAFHRIYGYIVAAILFFHLAVNIGMVIGITPVIGIPLPFFSYGGSSLWAFTILLFIFLRLDAARGDRM